MSEPKIFHLLHLAHRAVFRAADRVLAERFEITSQQHGVLLFLSHNDGMPMGQVASALGLKNAATSGLIDRMQKKKLIERKPSTTDRRSYTVYLLARGKDILQASQSLIATANREILEGFSPADKAQLAAHLDLISKRAEAILKN